MTLSKLSTNKPINAVMVMTSADSKLQTYDLADQACNKHEVIRPGSAPSLSAAWRKPWVTGATHTSKPVRILSNVMDWRVSDSVFNLGGLNPRPLGRYSDA
jgi:hypothetical protein